MSDRQAETFEVCLSAIEKGADPERCLSLFPDLSPELRPALETARLARLVSEDPIPDAALQRSRARLLRKAADLRERPHPRKPTFLWPFGLPRIALAALAVTLVLVVGWQGIFVASAKALPGDPLYPVKRAVENLSLSLRPENEARRAVEVHYERRRAGEVLGLLALGRAVDVRFTGVVNEMSPDRWTVDDIPVLIAPQTEVTGGIELGMVVEVSGRTGPEGLVAAAGIRLHSYQFVGKVEEIGSSVWIISGTELQVLPSSQLDPGVRVGDAVLVLVRTSEGSPVRALAVLRLLQPALLPTVLSSQEAEAESTPDPAQIEIELNANDPGADADAGIGTGAGDDPGGQDSVAGSGQSGSSGGDGGPGDHPAEEADSAEDHDRNDGGSGDEHRDQPDKDNVSDGQNEADPQDENHNEDQDGNHNGGHDSGDSGEGEDDHREGSDGDHESENGNDD